MSSHPMKLAVLAFLVQVVTSHAAAELVTAYPRVPEDAPKADYATS